MLNKYVIVININNNYQNKFLEAFIIVISCEKYSLYSPFVDSATFFVEVSIIIEQLPLFSFYV